MDQENQEQQSTSISPNPGALETSEKGTKKSGKLLIIILILVALAGVGFGVYGMFLKPEPTPPACPACVAKDPEEPEKPTEQEEQPPQETPTPAKQEEQIFQETQEPTEQKSFKSSLDLSRFKTQLDDGQKYRITFPSTELHFAKVSFEKNDNGEWLIIPFGTDDIREQVLNLSGEPAQIFIGSFGVDDGGTTPLFILQDGTVEYFRLYDGKGERNTDFTIQKFKNLKNIIRLQQAYSYNSNGGGGGYTVIAEDKDGYYYDLVFEFEF